MTRRGQKPRVEIRDRAVDLGGRPLPNNPEAEIAVLASMLYRASAIDDAMTVPGFGAAVFHADCNRRIAEVALEMHGEGRLVDATTIAHELQRRERLQSVGGIKYLAHVLETTAPVAHVTAHAKILVDHHRVRQAIEIAQLKAAEGYAPDVDADAYLDDFAQRACDLAQSERKADGAHVYDITQTNVTALLAAQNRGSALAGYPTGLAAVDERTGGLFPGDLIIVAARPGMGKTSYLLDIAGHLAEQPGVTSDDPETDVVEFDGYAVHVFSLEMPKEQLIHRMTAARAQLDVSAIRRRMLTSDEVTDYMTAANAVAQLPIWIYDGSACSVVQIRAHVRAAQRRMPKRRHVIGLDYLQLMAGDPNAHSREEAVSGISRGLKGAAKDLRVPIIALSQLNRSVETRSTKDKRPTLSDLRESGALEQDADVIEFIYRPEYYDAKPENKAFAVIDIAKQRNGPTGDCAVAFRDSLTHFENPTDTDRDQWASASADGNAPMRRSRRGPYDAKPGFARPPGAS